MDFTLIFKNEGNAMKSRFLLQDEDTLRTGPYGYWTHVNVVLYF